MTPALAAESLAATLAGRAMDAATSGPADDWAPVDEGLRELEQLNTLRLEVDFAISARRIASTDGAVPLLGAGRRSAPYPALLWNGDRASSAGLGPPASLTLVGLVTGQDHESDATRLVRGVRAGLAIRDSRLWPGTGVIGPTASVTTDVISAAACAAVSTGMGLGEVAKVLDLAGSLMIIKPASSVGSANMSGQWSGHALAAGWLAVQLHRAGVSGMSGGLEHTLTCIAGSREDSRRSVLAPSGSVEGFLSLPPSTVDNRRIVEALG
jgi:hypothetical protein